VKAPLPSRARSAVQAVTRPAVVVKLGGSMIRSAALHAWLDAIAAAPLPVIVVPGGGALADEVRNCQSQLGFGDPAAHRMALLAMDQLAWAVAGMRPGFAVGATEQELAQALSAGHVAVWAPYGLVAGRAELEETWRLTSDSLALWLAGRIGAAQCYLIKSIARRGTRVSANQLARDGVVDEAFPAMLQEAGIPAALLGQGDQQAFAASLAGGTAFGTAIE
jgi:dihydroneopterin aldolase